MKKAFVLITLLAGLMLPALGLSKVYAEKLPAQESQFVDKIFNFYNQADDKAIFRDSVTSRFRLGSDFSSFQQTMADIRKKLGGAGSKEELFLTKDYWAERNRYFYRVAFDVHHQQGIVRHYFVLMPENGHIFIDGWAMRYKGQFILAQGNLYDMPLEKGGYRALITAIPSKTLKDPRTDSLLKEAQDSRNLSPQFRQEQLRQAIEEIRTGHYKVARYLLYNLKHHKMFLGFLDDLDKGLVKPQAVEGIFKAFSDMLDNDWQKAQKDIQQAMIQDDQYWPIDFWALAIEDQIIKNNGKKMSYFSRLATNAKKDLYFFKLTTNLMRSPGTACTPKEEIVKGKFIEHCHIRVFLSMEWTQINGKLEGEVRMFSPEGIIYKKLNYTHGVLDGRQEYYYPNGKLAGWQLYKNGKLKEQQQLDSW